MPKDAWIAIRIGKKHREILLEDRLFISPRICQIIREAPLREPIDLIRGDWDHIQGCLAQESNHTEDQAWAQTLDRIFRKIELGCYSGGV